MRQSNAITRFGVLDIGTNSIRLAVIETQGDFSWSTLTQAREPVRLGDDAFTGEHHRIRQDALERGALVCARFSEMARGYGAREMVALATAAVREAQNQDDFVEQVSKATDGFCEVRVISGTEEARLIHAGVASGVDIAPDEKCLFIDIGGGSTELIVGDNQRYFYLDSLKLGAIRMSNAIIGERTGPVTTSMWTALQRHIRSALTPAMRAIRREGFVRLYGSSGTVTTLADISARRANADGGAPTTLRNYSLSLVDLQNVTQMLCKLPLEARKRVPGLAPERADIIIGGAAILVTAMEALGAYTLLVSDRGLREGIVIDHLMRKEQAQMHLPLGSVRDRSTRRLARRCMVDVEHAGHIGRLAFSLFDQARSVGLHHLGPNDRELLGYASLLHDCGFFVSHTGHHLHSYYLIRHSELLGFNDIEVEAIAQIALHHRRGLPRRKEAGFANLPVHEQGAVRVLSCILRLAESLDRSHLSAVSCVELRLDPRTRQATLQLTPAPGSDASLELWATEGQTDAFYKTFGATLVVEMENAAESSAKQGL